MASLLPQIPGDPSLHFDKEVDRYMQTFYYDLFFEKEINLEFRNFENNESLSRVVRIRIMTYRDDMVLKQIRLEILDDSDLYFFVESIFDEEKFEQMKNDAQLLIDFDSFPEEIRDLIEDSQINDSESQIVFIEENDGSGVMEFLQILELKSVEVFKINFVPSDPEFIQLQVQYRFNQLYGQLAKNKAILHEFNKQLQSKNPILLKSINTPSKSPRRSPK
ncbi:hypothetical protein TRFO_25432 [Tritrichomonas foetus]|uniref:Spindle assembly abnormal protein 6 N-terminal domain-containing protein n=1 Tax=Tritrichomonas foetus TaxID=1144522 RepID=A0A1J4KA59_9EUKA|nr:hypothetical protein TRFO_25432 [Tritrichomonas foetus]|eukprot:OHT06542.1 hypothetical protein TRFO_25432 [Tritrichomonas foetus]